MAKRIDVSDLDIYYGDFRAVAGRHHDHRAAQRHRADRPVRLREVDLPAVAQPDARGASPAPASRARSCIDGQDLYGADVDPVDVRRQIGMVFQRPNPFPTMSIYDNVAAGLRLNASKMKKADLDDLVEQSLRGANLWNEVKDRLDRPGSGPVRRSAAAAVHRPRDRRRARRPADGRAVLRARPDLHAGHRGPDDRAQGALHDRHRHAQHAAGRAGERAHRLLQPRRRRASPAG